MNLIIGVTSLIFFGFFFLIYRTYETGREELTEKVFFDDVTGGYNKVAFKVKYREFFENIEPYTYAVILLDANNFTLINEKFGQEGGDRLLKYAHETIERHLNEAEREFAARSELDHFILCMKEGDPEVIQKRLDLMIADINDIWAETGANHPIVFRQAGYIVDEQLEIGKVLDRVRVALQKQRVEAGEKCLFYNQALMESIKRNHKLENMFEESIANHDFEMYLQPKVEYSSRKLKGAEALVRWKHPKEGMIFPSEFIPLFEKDGKIEELDRYMFEEVCRYINKRECDGKLIFPISVNLSKNHFQTPGFLTDFAAISDKYHIARNLLEFELTESIFLDGLAFQKLKDSVHEIHNMGFKCSIDDFGTGYSSLGLLREIEIDVLKLDRSFFEDISNKKARTIIKSLVELSKGLDVQTVAEGIETQEQLNELAEMPCDLIQGYVFSKPLSTSDFEEWEKEFYTSEKYKE